MDPQQFDALTRRLRSSDSRRRVLAALAGSTFGQVLILPTADLVAAKCKKGRKRCLGHGHGCQNLNTDPDHCGECDHACPAAKPCCIKGKCREQCSGTCCADCFVEILLNGHPDEDHPVCCTASGGTICEHNNPEPGDDRCCYPNQVCIKGKCCCDNCEGSVKCGGKCCAIAACCNGKCCEQGKVCATKEADAEETCVPANRACGLAEPPCFPGESCLDGTCCSGLRECNDGDNEFCCAAGEYCAFKGQLNAQCCPINTSCSTYRGHRVRR